MPIFNGYKSSADIDIYCSFIISVTHKCWWRAISFLYWHKAW